MVNLAHFKGHTVGGFGGVLKNQSIGVSSQNGKAYQHSTGLAKNYEEFNARLEEFNDDCDAHPADPEMKDIGILASLDPSWLKGIQPGQN